MTQLEAVKQIENAPVTLNRFLRLRELLSLIPLSRSTLYAKINEGTFPKPVKFGRCSMWRSEEIAQWLASPSNSNFVQNDNVARVASQSKLFAEDIKTFVELSRQIELVALGVLAHAYVSRQSQSRANAYDRSCLERLKRRRRELEAGEPGTLDILGYWRP